jgi:hypothetical protein
MAAVVDESNAVCRWPDASNSSYQLVNVTPDIVALAHTKWPVPLSYGHRLVLGATVVAGITAPPAMTAVETTLCAEPTSERAAFTASVLDGEVDVEHPETAISRPATATGITRM